jgi:hypothetical protein
MGAKSSIEKLPDAVRVEVGAAIKRGATVDQITWMLKGLGADVSRSAVGRYTKQYANLAARQRDVAAVAQSFAGEFGTADDLQGRLLVQVATTIATRMAMEIGADDDDKLGIKDLMNFGRAVKDITSAAKIDVDREAKIRSEEGAKARSKAANDAEAAGKAAGASPETIDLIKRKILEIS